MSTNAFKIDDKIRDSFKNVKNRDEFVKIYDLSASSGDYEKDLALMGYEGRYTIPAQALVDYFGNDLENLELLDLACGTGLLGVELFSQGFHTIDGLDASQGMLDVAREKGVYRKLLQEFVEETPSKMLTEGQYDAVVSVGATSPRHLPAGSIYEMSRIVKTGGIVIIFGAHDRWDEGPEDAEKIEDVIKKCVSQGKLEILKRKTLT